jgi:hypothetical protein
MTAAIVAVEPAITASQARALSIISQPPPFRFVRTIQCRC